MAPLFAQDFIDRVLETVDLVDVVSDYVQLKKAGSNYKGLCPFHQEKTPSFMVSQEKNLYYCFGCGAGGNLFSFLQEIERISFPEAVRISARRVGLSLPEASKEDPEQRDLREKIFELNKKALSFYREALNKNKEAQKYLRDRGYGKKEIEVFNLAYAPEGWDNLGSFLREEGYPEELLVKAGLVVESSSGQGYYDCFRHRIIFPIHNPHGEVIGFGGRVLGDDQPKYLNSPATPIFDKKNVLYGMYLQRSFFRQQRQAVIVEGYTDVITASKEGISGLVASLGTSLTEGQAGLIGRYVDLVYIAYDADTAGTRATWRGLDILESQGLKVRVVPVPTGKDPDDLIAEEGADAFRRLIGESLSLFEFKLRVLLEEKNPRDLEDKLSVISDVFGILMGEKNRIRQEEYLYRVAQKLDLTPDTVLQEFRAYRAKKLREEARVSGGKAATARDVDLGWEMLHEVEMSLLYRACQDYEAGPLISQLVAPEEYLSEETRALAEFIYQQQDIINMGPAQIISQLADEGQKNIFSRLLMGEERLKERDLWSSIQSLKEYHWKKRMNYIWDRINKKREEHDLKGLNKLLLSFSQLLAEEEYFMERRGNYD